MCRGTSVPDGEGLRLIFPDGKPSAEVRVFCVPLRLLSLHNTSNLLLPIYEPQRKPKYGYLCATRSRVLARGGCPGDEPKTAAGLPRAILAQRLPVEATH